MTKKKITILLVDDERDFLDSMTERFELKGFEVHTAESGTQALEMAKNQHFHAAVVDYKMPDMDGLVTITKLKEQQPNIKTILLTGFGNEKVKQTTEALNSDYFEKDEMTSFWSFIRHLPENLENYMAAAGIATGGGIDDARKYREEKDED